MSKRTELVKLAGTLTVLRGVILVMAGMLALFFPTEGLWLAVYVGGAMLLVDGVLNIATVDFNNRRVSRFWVAAARTVFSILAGLAILFSSWLIPVLSFSFLLYFVGLQAVAIGLLEMVEPFMPPRSDDVPLWSGAISGGIYMLFGLALMVIPLASAIFLAQTIAVLMIIFGATLLLRAWQERGRVGLAR
jgi:uncharacterized membrane protein HdeD (DUF308 family)